MKQKRRTASRARDLYTSPLFAGRRRFVERTCDRWFILSAMHGLVDPEQHLEPYDLSLNELSHAERRTWSEGVVRSLEAKLGPLMGLRFELHAGASYLDFGLTEELKRRGASMTRPTRGMPMGKQLQFYGR